MTLRPGSGGSRAPLQIERLRPLHVYDLHGTVEPVLTADGEGRALVHIDLDARAEIQIAPRD
ncbi:MAG: hypothetical protein ACYDHH_24525 [Solirubrobacteraceae bacterium]